MERPLESCKAYADEQYNTDETYNEAYNNSGLYRISPEGGCEFLVFCDMCLASDKGRGWIVVQRRVDDSLSFELKLWEDYKRGFGDYLGNYWIGLQTLHQITSSGDYDLFVGFSLTSFGHTRRAFYTKFTIGSEEEGYKMDYTYFDTTRSSGLSTDHLSKHKGDKFSTLDRDNDEVSAYDCANGISAGDVANTQHYGGWWFGDPGNHGSISSACYQSNLNGKYYSNGVDNIGNGLKWGNAAPNSVSLLKTIMAIRRV